MANKFLSSDGVRYFWAKLKAKLENKSDKGHTHSASEVSGLSAVAKSGNYNDLLEPPTIPTTLPANGGNADTVDGYHIRTAKEGDTGLKGYITFITE